MPVWESTEQYIMAQTKQAQEALLAMQRILQAALPAASECISYSMPALRIFPDTGEKNPTKGGRPRVLRGGEAPSRLLPDARSHRGLSGGTCPLSDLQRCGTVSPGSAAAGKSDHPDGAVPAPGGKITEMRYDNVCPAVFVRRNNRFTAEVLLGEQEITVHVKNTGRLRELLLPGADVILTESNNANRRTAYDLIGAYRGGKLYNIDSQAPNAVTFEWLRTRGFDEIRPETVCGSSRIDFWM